MISICHLRKPGGVSLREVLQNRQALKIEETESLLCLLADGCEAAVRRGWPRIMLDSAHLYLDQHLGLLRIPLPDIPSFDAAANTLAFDPTQTMQFNAAELSQTFDLPPKDTGDYVRPLAALCCDLLGQPQSVRGGNARYQPVPQLSSSQNVLLRRALTNEGRSGFNGAKAFVDEFFGARPSVLTDALTENLRALTVTLSATEAKIATPVEAAAVRMPPPLPPTTTSEAPYFTQPGTAPLRVSEEDAAALENLPLATRLRLIPDRDGPPVLAFCAEGQLIFGRSSGDADFVTQFRPAPL